jgi:hypothetical protein
MSICPPPTICRALPHFMVGDSTLLSVRLVHQQAVQFAGYCSTTGLPESQGNSDKLYTLLDPFRAVLLKLSATSDHHMGDPLWVPYIVWKF